MIIKAKPTVMIGGGFKEILNNYVLLYYTNDFNHRDPSNVSVNSNWVNPPPRENFFERANPGHPGNLCLIPCPRGKT